MMSQAQVESLREKLFDELATARTSWEILQRKMVDDSNGSMDRVSMAMNYYRLGIQIEVLNLVLEINP